ncbi:hypothetical protein [Halorhabdus salina]|uniref:hypothetical protein n=1 Tax=Halorhabdus salina TaxID=2750670 RepID=UPI0015EF62A2|nr:hypothetical protein [Halorhabdus salina]
MASERLRECVGDMDDATLAEVVRAVRRADGDDAAVQTRGSHVFVLFKGDDESKGIAWICAEEAPTTDRLEKFPALVEDLGADQGIVTNATGEPIDNIPDEVEYLDFDGIVNAIEAAGLTETVLATHGESVPDDGATAAADDEQTDTPPSDTPRTDNHVNEQPATHQPPTEGRLSDSQEHRQPPQEQQAETPQPDSPQTDQRTRTEQPSASRQAKHGGRPPQQNQPQREDYQPQGRQPQQGGQPPRQGQPQQGGQPSRQGQPQQGGQPPQKEPAPEQPPPGQVAQGQPQQGGQAGGGPPDPGPSGRRGPPGSDDQTGPGRTFDRLRHSALPLVVLVLVVGGAAAAGAWQLGLIGGDDDSGPASTLDVDAVGSVPSDVDFVLAVDGRLADDETTRTLVDAALDSPDTRFDTVSGSLDRLESTWGIEPSRIEQILMFGRQAETVQGVAYQLQVSGSVSAESIADTMATDTVEQTVYAETTAYRVGVERTAQEEQWVAAPENGTVLVGSPAVVKDALAVRNGDTSAWNDRLRERFKAIDGGSIRLATRIPGEGSSVPGIDRARMLTGVYETAGSEITVRATLYAGSTDTAEAVATSLDGTIGSLLQELRGSERYSDATDVLTGVSVRTDGSAVVIRTTAEPSATGTLASIFLRDGGFIGTDPPVVTEPTPTQSPTDRVVEVATVGSDIRNGTIGSVNMTVRLAPDSESVDLRDAVVEWVESDGRYQLTSQDAAGADGRFTVHALRDDDDSIREATTLNGPEDRAVLHFEPGTTFGRRLAAGEAVELQLNTQSGGETTVTLVVPDSLSGKESVSL